MISKKYEVYSNSRAHKYVPLHEGNMSNFFLFAGTVPGSELDLELLQ
jgi:hypothetical protein